MEKAQTLLGGIDSKESQEIEPIVERLAGLEELLLIVEDASLSEKIKKEMEGLEKLCKEWWKDTVARHNWDVSCDVHWAVDCQENKVWISC